MDPNVRKYKAYTRWLNSLPTAHEVGEYRERGSFCVEYIFKIDGRSGTFLLGATGGETDQSVIASLPQGNLLKARVFKPKRKGSP